MILGDKITKLVHQLTIDDLEGPARLLCQLRGLNPDGAPPQPPQMNSEWGDSIKRQFSVIYAMLNIGTEKAVEQAAAGVASFEASVDELDHKMLELAAENERLKAQLKAFSTVADTSFADLIQSASVQPG